MRDPHVVRLHYKLHVDHSLLFERDTDVDRGAYRLHRHATDVEAEMVDHFASVTEARGVVEPDLRGWAIYPALASRQKQFFRFEFVRPEVIDRAPPEPPRERGVVQFGVGIESTSQVGACTVTVSVSVKIVAAESSC